MFRKFTSDQDLPSVGSITQPDYIPVYLVPGIFRNPREMLVLAKQLNDIYKGQRPIYTFYDEPSADSTTSERIVIALNNVLPRDPVPCLLVGYSDGCDKAFTAAKTLEAQGKSVQVCAVDGAPAHIANQYFSSRSTAAIQDLVNIVNYAAQLSGFKQEMTLTDTEKSSLFNLFLESRINHLANLSREANHTADGEAHHKFLGYILEAKNNFKAKKSDDPDSPDNKIKLVAFLTNHTVLNYAAGNCAGWEKEIRNLTLVTDPVLADVGHQDLLKTPHVDRLASLINGIFLKNAVDIDDFFTKQAEFLAEERERASSKSSAQASNSNSDVDSDYDLVAPHSPTLNPKYTPIPASREALVSSGGLYGGHSGRSSEVRAEGNELKRSWP